METDHIDLAPGPCTHYFETEENVGCVDGSARRAVAVCLLLFYRAGKRRRKVLIK
jgi:thiamine pyrophosphokinase